MKAVYRPLEYATKRKMAHVNAGILLAWIAALCVSLPMHADVEGNNFSNFNHLMTEETVLDNNLGGCQPPIDPGSKGFVMYAAVLAFIIPTIILITLQTAIMIRKRGLAQRRIDRDKEQTAIMIRKRGLAQRRIDR